jgi:hypothetical protein
MGFWMKVNKKSSKKLILLYEKKCLTFLRIFSSKLDYLRFTIEKLNIELEFFLSGPF